MNLLHAQAHCYAPSSSMPFSFLDSDESKASTAEVRSQQQHLLHLMDLPPEADDATAATGHAAEGI